MTGSTVGRSLLIVFSMVAAALVFVVSLWIAFSQHGERVPGLVLALCAAGLGVISAMVGRDHWHWRARAVQRDPEHPMNRRPSKQVKRGRSPARGHTPERTRRPPAPTRRWKAAVKGRRRETVPK
jgi:type IV secretory pathway TrbD component